MFIAVAIFTCLNERGLAAPEPMPLDLKAFLAKIHVAEKRKDFATLKAGMIADFTWSFGGDVSADQALEAWRQDGHHYLKALAAVTQADCARTGTFRMPRQCRPCVSGGVQARWCGLEDDLLFGG